MLKVTHKLLLIFVFILIVAMISCTKNQTAYTINRDNDGWYIQMNNNPEQYSNNYQILEDGSLSFNSVAEMRDSFVNYKLTDDQLRIIDKHFSKDDNGNIRLKIDFDNLYVPVISDGFFEAEVGTSGSDYTVKLNDESGLYIQFNIGDNCWGIKQFDMLYNTDYSEYTDVKYETAEERNSDIYYYEGGFGECKDIKYKIECESKIIFVREFYILEAKSDSDPSSDTVPYSAYIFVYDENGEDYMVFMNDLTERPSIEFISELKLERYDESIAEKTNAPVDTALAVE